MTGFIDWVGVRSSARQAFACLVPIGTALAGCAGSDPPVEFTRAGFSCVDDSVECIGRRQALLRQLQADQTRSWMREPPSPEAYASGVRLFAMRTKKHELTCDELTRGRTEADGAPFALRGQTARFTQAQISRGTMFASDVSRELGTEFARRCKKS